MNDTCIEIRFDEDDYKYCDVEALTCYNEEELG